jgi:hypothetical protein
MMLAVDFLTWGATIIVPLAAAALAAAPGLLAARKMLQENRSQHGDNGGRLDVVANEVRDLSTQVGAISDKMDRFIYRTEAWRDHVEEEFHRPGS